MKKQFTVLVLFLAAFGFSARLNAQTPAAPSAGDGSSGSPYEIATWQNLYWISQDDSRWDKHYKQTADIDLSVASPAITGWDGNQGWTPIGNGTTNFTGSYDGQGYTINALFISRSSSDNMGLFGVTNGATISNLGLTNVDVTGNVYVGGLLGYNWDSSTIQNSYSAGSVSGNSNVGGLVGYTFDGAVQNSYNTGSVSGSGSGIGGLVGYNEYCTIQNSYSTGSVTGTNFVGGLVGENWENSTIQNSYSAGSVSGSGGGIGGLVGYNNEYCTIQNSYSAGSVSGSGGGIGGLVGYNDGGTVTNSFWDTETSGQTLSPGGGTDKTTAKMQSLATFTETDSLGLDQPWDFVGNPNDDVGNDDIWHFDGSTNNGYPFLEGLAEQNSATNTIPAGNTDAHSFVPAGASVQFTVGNAGPIQLNIVRTNAEPNVFGSLPGSVQNLSPRYWSATVTSGSADGTYDITLDLTGVPGINDCQTLYVLKRNDAGSAWQDVVADLGATLERTDCPNSITVQGLTGFSDFVIGGGSDNPLPVELFSFTGSAKANGVQLNWVTASETDNDGFILLRNGEVIATHKNASALDGQGTKSGKTAYRYLDQSVELGTYIYTLRSEDISGLIHDYDFSVNVEVKELGDGSPDEVSYALEQNYPNPFNPSTTITYTMKKAGVATLKVYDVLGRMVFEQTKASVKGENQINFNGSNLTSGVYYYQLNAEGFSKTLKMMLVK